VPDDLGPRLREAALLEGDFVLRSGRRSRFYLDKYRFETRPDLLRDIGAALAERARAVDPGVERLAGPELGGVALAAAASLASGLPFLIVRGEAKAYGTGRRVEGAFEPGERIVVVEDVVTTGGAAREAVEALREQGLHCDVVVAVVDRLEGGAEGLAEAGIRLVSLVDASALGLVAAPPADARTPHG
jgi:orotate phosphoribosyltransferase